MVGIEDWLTAAVVNLMLAVLCHIGRYQVRLESATLNPHHARLIRRYSHGA
jgi:hypothetical protein